MIGKLKHAVRHSGFIHKHPLLTFGLMALGVGVIFEGATKLTAKKPTTSQPTPTTTATGGA